MSMQCPRCGGSHIQPMAVVHADGTQQFQTVHTAFTSDGQFVQGHSQGSQATLLAQHCAPPAPPSPMPFVIAYGMGGLITYLSMTVCSTRTNECRYLGLAQTDWKWTLGGLAIIGLGWLLMKGWYAEAQSYGAEKRRWQNTWFCHGCGQSHLRG